jgi:hypothetical protein
LLAVDLFLYSPEACSGRLHEKLNEDVYVVLDSAKPWLPLHPDAHSQFHQSLALAMAVRGSCGVEQLSASEGYPWKLWLLLQDAKYASIILRDPHCTEDLFGLEFVQMFPDEQQLTSSECRVLLIALAIAVRYENARLECRFASIRRLMLIKS